MILTGPQIQNEVRASRITLDPFDPAFLNPNSYNFRLGNRLLVYRKNELDSSEDMATDSIEIPAAGFVLEPSRLYLGHTVEIMGSEHYAPMICGRSSIGRAGLFINITAPLGDIGFVGQWTLQLHSAQRLRVYPELRIGQIFFWVPCGQIALYSGKYQNARGPRKSQSWKDFRG